MSKIEVDPWLERWGKRVCNHPKMWMRLGRFENILLSDRLSDKKITAPIYVTGMARSGSTILLEILNQHPATKSFTYQDFPFVHIPWFWSQFLKVTPQSHQPEERAHKDRIMITPQSPEAMEEMLWIHCFPNIHDEQTNHIKDSNFNSDSFEKHYTSTIKKLLIAYEAKRYLSKGNYNITRIRYLLKLFPDARFIVPIRHPIAHIKSSIKQHNIFQKQDQQVVDHLHREGHFEFGNDRQAINTGDSEQSQQINSLWKNGDDLLGYALQWKYIYDYVFTLQQDPQLKNSILVMKYEDLCEDSKSQLGLLFEHARLSDADNIIEEFSSQLSVPDYYQHNFSDEELEKLWEIVGDVAGRFGYLISP